MNTLAVAVEDQFRMDAEMTTPRTRAWAVAMKDASGQKQFPRWCQGLRRISCFWSCPLGWREILRGANHFISAIVRGATVLTVKEGKKLHPTRRSPDEEGVHRSVGGRLSGNGHRRRGEAVSKSAFMPSRKTTLSKQDVADVVEYIRKLPLY